jgi:lipopolysaccharide biosynthesis glycosyltransferase
MPTNPPLEIAFCADRNMLAALHVAAVSVLSHAGEKVEFLILGENLSERDVDLLRESLSAVGKESKVRYHKLDSAKFRNCPKLSGSLANYYRLLVPEFANTARCVYIDCDTFCQADISKTRGFDLQGNPIGMCSEAPLVGCQDAKLAVRLGKIEGWYFNSGFLVFDTQLWKQGNYAEKCLNYSQHFQPDYHEQSALNELLFGSIAKLPKKFNLLTNVRANWSLLRKPRRGAGCLLHFVDYPKPWSAMGRWIHPFGQQWWGEYQKTAHFRKNPHTPAPVQWDSKTRFGYHKALKDKLLFSLYERGVLRPKGVPTS